MDRNQWEIVILKPTPVFLSFLAAQISEYMELPSLELLQTDATAYTIAKYDDEEQTLQEIERLYPQMFRHEILRWLGTEEPYEIEGSFIDFLCCFKFEMHAQIILMEPEIGKAHQLIRVKPRTVFLQWMKDAVQHDGDLSAVMEQVNVARLGENATLVVHNFGEPAAVKPFLSEFWEPVFEAEMLRMCSEPEKWPEVDSFDIFRRYFAAEIHTRLIHLHQEV